MGGSSERSGETRVVAEQFDAFKLKTCHHFQLPAMMETHSCEDQPVKVDSRLHVCVHVGDESRASSSVNVPFMANQG